MSGPFDGAIRTSELVDLDRRRKEEIAKQPQSPSTIVFNSPVSELIMPNYSGIKPEALKSNPSSIGGGITTETDPVWISMSGSYTLSSDFTTHTGDSTDPHGATLTQTSLSGTNVWGGVLSGANTFVTNRFSGGNVWTSVLSGTNIWGYNTISGASLMTTEDHTTSGSAKVVGIITHTSATPPTASNYAQGTLYVQYTA